MQRYRHLAWNQQNIGHIARHHVTPDEVEQAVFSQSCLKRKGRGDGIYYILGKTDSGRYLFIVLRDWGAGTALPITARDMSESEKKLCKG